MQSGSVGDAFLSGLINVNIQNLNLQAQSVIDVRDILNNDDIPVLVQALTSNTVATQNAARLTTTMQQQGKLAPDEAVVGRSSAGHVLKMKKG